jgi:hypothetical protein
MNFAAAADQLRRQEIARLSQYVTPPVEALRSLTPGPFREQIALMVERLGHTVQNNPTAADLITAKQGEKYIIACATPSDPAPTAMRDVARLHDVVIAQGAQRGIYVTTRNFTPEAQDYAASMPAVIQLVDGAKLAQSLKKSNVGATLPSRYKAMCHVCGEVVEHNLDHGTPLPCVNGHLVAPTIARAALVRERHPVPPAAARSQYRDMSPKAQRRRQIRHHNHKVRGRAIKQQRGSAW